MIMGVVTSNLNVSWVKRKRSGKKIVLTMIIILIALIIAGFTAIPPLMMKDMVKKHVDFETLPPDRFGVNADEISLTTEDGLRLASWEVKAKDPRGIVIFLSGIHNPSVTAYFGHAKMLAEKNFSSLLIEMRSHGKSEGKKIYVGTKEYLDTKAGVQYILSRSEYKDLPIIVFGVSMGGAAAINSIGEIPELDGLISVSAFSSWPDVFCDNMVKMGLPELIANVEKPFVKLYMGFEYGFGNLKYNPLNEIKKLNGRPALLMHSDGDSQVPYKSFERLQEAAPGQFDMFIREGDHHFICLDDYFDEPWKDKEYADAILTFLEKNF
jgi:hypothetical protein